MTAQNGLYRGYSSHEFESTGSFKLNDVELIKMDLLNHIFTRRGERVMMPRFGTIIPDLVFEPLDTETIDQVESELRTVIDYDPRVELLDLTVSANPDGNAVTAAIRIRCVELNTVELMNLNIEFEAT